MADLINYHGNSKVIGRICELLNSMTGVSFRKVQTLPQTGESNVIYLVPKSTSETDNVFDEYIWIDNDWELIGTTEIDLSNYYTKTEVDNLIPDELKDLSDDSTHRLVTDTEKSTWSGKANTSDIKDGTLTIQLNGTDEQTFTANSSTNKTANIKAVDWVSNGKLGTKNLNSFPYYHDSRTLNYVAWTINADGSVTANGTASGGNSNFACHSRNMELNKLVLPNGKYILSGCATGGSSSTWEISLERTHNGSAETIVTNRSGDTEFTLNGDDYSANFVQVQLILRVRNGKQANNITFYPMIRLAEDTDNTWKPYAMTNRELTEVVNGVPTNSGTYSLKATRDSSGNITYSWV